jgi:hypothetical protein
MRIPTSCSPGVLQRARATPNLSKKNRQENGHSVDQKMRAPTPSLQHLAMTLRGTYIHPRKHRNINKRTENTARCRHDTPHLAYTTGCSPSREPPPDPPRSLANQLTGMADPWPHGSFHANHPRPMLPLHTNGRPSRGKGLAIAGRDRSGKVSRGEVTAGYLK